MVVNDNACNPDERQHFHHQASHRGNRQAGIEPEQLWTSQFGVLLGHRGHAFFIFIIENGGGSTHRASQRAQTLTLPNA
ncbi:hypothetical protein [Pseudomonas sp. S2_H10]